MNAIWNREELDLAVPDMRTDEDVRRASVALAMHNGIVGVRSVKGEMFVRYRPAVIPEGDVAEALENAGFRPSVMQELAH